MRKIKGNEGFGNILDHLLRSNTLRGTSGGAHTTEKPKLPADFVAIVCNSVHHTQKHVHDGHCIVDGGYGCGRSNAGPNSGELAFSFRAMGHYDLLRDRKHGEN